MTMTKFQTDIAVPLGVLLVALAVAFPVATTLQSAEQPGCTGGDSVCAELLAGISAEDGVQGLSLMQRTANIVTKTASSKSSMVVHGDAGKAGAPLSATSAPQTMNATTMASGGIPPIFFDPTIMDYPQLIFITMIYGYILYVGSNMIGDGSELLMFFKSVAGLVGSVVVPFLGAVPDSAMVLFSGLGPDAQVQVSTGVGALAGSTVMLLTFPWFIVNMAGSVPLKDDGTADYKRNSEPASLFGSGVTFGDSVKGNAKIMLVTSLSFLIIQIPAFFVDRPGVSIAQQAASESLAALAGLIASFGLFIGYMVLMYVGDSDDGKRNQLMIESIKQKQVSLCTVLNNLGAEEVDKSLPEILKYFFCHYDLDKSGQLDCKEFERILAELGERLTPEQAKQVFDKHDKDAGIKDGLMSFAEFTNWAKGYKPSDHRIAPSNSQVRMPTYAEEEDDDDEEEVLPDDLADLTPAEQERAMVFRSLGLMGFGTVVVLLFSDPAVNVFTEWGNRLGISSFYVGFVLAPFASNASELLVALGYARAKTTKKITMAFESLVGAACMNNTLCLGVFFALVYFKSLAWTFKAETASILIVQWVMTLIIHHSNTQRKVMGFAILALYPGCLMIVWGLENLLGWD